LIVISSQIQLDQSLALLVRCVVHYSVLNSCARVDVR